MKNYKIWSVLIVSLFLIFGAIFVTSQVVAATTYPTVSNAVINDSASRVYVPAGNSFTIGWDFVGFSSPTKYVTIRLCKPGSSNCSSWTKLTTDGAVDPADIIPSNGLSANAQTGGSGQTTKSVGPKMYDRLAAGDPAVTPFFDSEKKTQIKVCPSDASGVTPSGAKCGYSPYLVVTPSSGTSATLPPTITDAYLSGGISWEVGTSKTINWSYNNFTPSVHQVKFNLCKTRDNSDCSFFGLADSGATSLSSGSASHNLNLPTDWAPAGSYFVQVCPLSGAGIPSNAVCSYVDFDLKSTTVTPPIVPAPSITIRATPNSLSLGSTASLSWSSSNMPAGATCVGNNLSGVSGWSSTLISGLSGSNKPVTFTGSAGTRTLTITCTASGKTYASSTVVTVLGIPPSATVPTVSDVEIYRNAVADHNWPAGNVRTIKWSFASPETNVHTVSLSFCNPNNRSACTLWGTSGFTGLAATTNGGLIGNGQYEATLGPKMFSRSGSSTDSVYQYFSNRQAVVKVCPTASINMTGAGIGTTKIGWTCAYSQPFTVTDPNDAHSPTWDLPSGQGCFVGECVCVNGVKMKCGNPMQPYSGCTGTVSCPAPLSLAGQMMASLGNLSGWLFGLIGFNK